MSVIYEMFRFFQILAFLKIEFHKKFLNISILGALILQSFIFIDIPRIIASILYLQDIQIFIHLSLHSLLSVPMLVYLYSSSLMPCKIKCKYSVILIIYFVILVLSVLINDSYL